MAVPIQNLVSYPPIANGDAWPPLYSPIPVPVRDPVYRVVFFDPVPDPVD